jgi:hypothetical protein
MRPLRAPRCPSRRIAIVTALAMLGLFVSPASATASATRPVPVAGAAPGPAAVPVAVPATPDAVRPGPQGSGLSGTTSVMQIAFSLTRDSDGQVPAKGDSVTLLFAGGGVAWFLATSSTGDLSVQGTWSYAGGKISLALSTTGFVRKGTFRADLGASSIVIPFQVFSAKPGTSTWAASAVDPAAGAQTAVLAAAEAAPSGLTPDQIVTTAAQYLASVTGAPISAGAGFSTIAGGASASSSTAQLLPSAPRLKSVETFRARYSLPPEAPAQAARLEAMGSLAASGRHGNGFWDSDGVSVTGVIELSDAVMLQMSNTKTVTVVLVPATVGGSGAELESGPFASDPRTDIVPKPPGIATDDPPVKKAFFWQPFNSLIIRTWTSANGTQLSSTVSGFAEYEHFDEEQTMLEHDGYQVLRATDGGATVAKLIQDLSGSTPGFIVLSTHGASDGSLLSGNYLGADFSGASQNLNKLENQLHDTYGVPTADINLASPPVQNTSPLQSAYFANISAGFWSWLRTKGGADFSHSLVLVDACDSDQTPALRNAFEARAYFTFSPTVTGQLGGAVEFYLVSELTRPTVTAEEAYYNMLRIDTTGKEAYSFDSIFNGVFKAQQGFNPKGVSAGIYQVLNAYGWDGSTMVPYVGNGWLTSGLDEGEIWTMLWASRWDGNTKQGIANLEGCWNALWSHLQLGGINSTCQQWTDGNVPSKNEYDYVIYLLTGKNLGFSHTLVPRFTLNDGR